jgi:transcriptional regulator with XRE-family HTH domain
MTRAASEIGISRGYLSLLENGLRRPSSSVAEDLICAYRMTEAEASAVRAIAIPWAGRDSPFRTGVAPGRDWEP